MQLLFLLKQQVAISFLIQNKIKKVKLSYKTEQIEDKNS